MKTLHMPSYFDESHRHAMYLKLHSLFHDDRFWAVLTVVMLLILLVGLGILAAFYGNGGSSVTTYPYYY